MNTTTENAKKLLIFDFDGVLCDSLTLVLHETRDLAKELGSTKTLTAEAIAEMDNVTFPEIAALAGIPDNAVADYAQKLYARLEANSASAQVFPGIKEMLTALAPQYTLAIVTANHPSVVTTVLADIAATSLFVSILGGETPGDKASKITRILKETASEKAQTWMIGDSRSDIREGKKAGVHTVAVTWGWQSEAALRDCAPTLVCDTPEALRTYFLSTMI